jgi:hypothetical protein
MNCRDFNNVVNELADGRPMEAATREAGFGHAADCPDCAAQLTGARGVGAALRVAARAESEEAPARVRQALLSAFAARQAGAQPAAPVEVSTVVEPSPVVELSSRRAWRRWAGMATAAAAAVFLLALTLPYLTRFSAGGPRSQPSQMTAALPTPAPPAQSGIAVAPTPETVGENKAAPVSTPAARNASTKQNASTRSVPALARKAPRLPGAAATGKSETAARGDKGNAGNDYLPLTYLAGANAMESGTVVRVEMSRSALISLGVPVSAERADELFKADVVIGDDGVARAIRLVGND